MLLRSNDHTGSHESHEGNHFIGGESILVDQVSANQAACTAEACLAMDCDTLLLDGDHLMGHFDKPSDKLQGRAGAILEDHVNMSDSHCGEVRWAVELRVESYNETDVALVEMGENILEWHRKLRGRDFRDCCGQCIVLRGVDRNGFHGLVLRRRKGKEIRRNPVEVTHVDSLKFLVSIETNQH